MKITAALNWALANRVALNVNYINILKLIICVKQFEPC